MKKRQIKKILSITLAVSVILANVPVGTSASETAQTVQAETSAEPKKKEMPDEPADVSVKQQGKSSESNGETTVSTSGSTEETTGSTSGNIGETTVSTSGKTGETTVSTSESTGETTGGTSGKIGETTVSTSGKTGETTGNTSESTGETTVSTSGSTGETTGSMSESTGETSGSTKDTDGTTGEDKSVSVGDIEKPKETEKKPNEVKKVKAARMAGAKNQGGSSQAPKAGPDDVKTVTVEWATGAADDKVWNGSDQAPKASAGGVEIVYEITKDGAPVAEATDPGNYTVTAKLAQADDTITLENAEVSFTIKKAQISFTWEIPEVTYTGNAIALPKATFVSAVDGSTIEAVVSVTDPDKLVDGEVINAGTYHVVAALPTEQENYYEIQGKVEAEFTVNQSPVEIIWNSTEVFYDAEPHFLDWKTDYNGDISVKYTDAAGGVVAAPTEAGTYTATAELADTNYTSASTGTLTIKKAEAEVIWSNTTLPYNGAAQKPTAAFTDVKGNAVTFDATEVNTDKESILPGEYTATVSADGYPNYTFTNISEPCNFTITQTVQVQWSNTMLPYNGEAQVPTASFTKVDGTTVECEVSAEDNPSDANAGGQTYTAEVVGTDGYPGYILENTTTTFTIVPAEAEVIWSNTTLRYNGAVQKPTATFTDVNGEKVTFDATEVNTNVESILPGEYTATVSADRYPNYTFTNISVPCNFEITKKTVEVQWSNTSLPYNGAAQKPTATFTDVNDKEVACTVEIKKDADGQEINATNAGRYTVVASCDDSNYNLTNTTTEFEISKLPVTITATEGQSKYYGAEDPERFGYDVKFDENVSIDKDQIIEELLTKSGQTEVLQRAEGENAGAYDLALTFDVERAANYIVSYTGNKFTIAKLPVTITATEGQSKYYGAEDPDHFDYEVKFDAETTNTTLTEEAVKNELNTELKSDILKREMGEAVREENYKYSLAASESTNFALTYEGESVFTIKKLPVTINAVADQWKWYGAVEPDTFLYAVSIDEEGVATNLLPEEIVKEIEAEFGEGKGKELLQREAGENAGDYKLSLTFEPADSKNYAISYGKDAEGNDFVYTIKKLPVTVNPTEKQSKIFGEIEPEYYGYSVEINVEINVDKGETQDTTTLTAKDVQKELGNYVLAREAGEAVGAYKFSLIPEDSAAFEKANFKNFELKVPEDAPTFKINTIKITSVDSISSRQSSFDVTTNLKGDRQKGVTTKFKFEIDKLPTSADGIVFSDDINTYITGASEGIAFSKASDTIKVNTAEYQKQRKDDKKMLSWNGQLPAGTVIKVTVVDENGVVVSAEPKYVTVSPVNVEIGWSGYETSATTENYVVANGGSVNPLTLSGNRTGEWVEMLYNADSKGEKASYGELNTTFTPNPNNAGSKHVMQTVSANVVDTLNLTCTPQEVKFYVDDMAFAIPSSAIQFENRGKEITIRLPEIGTVTSVNIPGATVEVSGEMGEEFQFPVDWSGMNLIPTGSAIAIEYTDQAGHQGTGGSSASRSSVSTPITFQIRPELNANGYLNGRSNTLIVSGAACSCEPIKVTIANMSQTTNATQQKVWSDSNGSWEVLLDMSRLPEGEDFTISAEYMDVDGAGYSISARFDAFCASPATLSPIYEAMTHISGMVEPGTAVALVINGDTQSYQEIQVDRFGRFAMDDVPMMFAGDDSFDIYVTDIAGNVSIKHYEIEEPDEPFEVNSYVNPLGKIFYFADESDSAAYAATPVSTSDFAENERLEIPLLMGMSYEVGTLTLEKTENGFTVYSEIKGNENLAVEDLGAANDRLYVYSSRPTIEELKNHTGQEYQYGMEIPFGESGEVWIVDDKDMTILAEDIANLELFDFENSEEYVKYQEK